MSGITHVVFDIGNVLVEWNPRHLYRKHFEREAEMEAFLSNVCTMDWHIAHDAGVSFEDNAEKLKARHLDHHELIDIWGARYLEMSPGAVPGMEALVGALKEKGLALHGLTNMPASIYPKLHARYPAMQALEVTVVSGEEKTLKPDPRLYEILIARAGLPVRATLYIDDSAPNVRTAEKLGMYGHHFQNAGGLARELTQLGLLEAS